MINFMHNFISKRTKNILNFIIPVIVVMVFVMPFFVQAATSVTDTGNKTTTTDTGNIKMNIKIDNPFKQDTIEGLIKTIVNDILMPIGGVIAVLMVMYAGFLFVTARGNEKQIGDAKQALFWAVIGAAILLGALVISQAISATINQLKAS
jgi:TRAP-type C4-dicarboxylate transport system permease small subunit